MQGRRNLAKRCSEAGLLAAQEIGVAALPAILARMSACGSETGHNRGYCDPGVQEHYRRSC